MSEKKNSCWAFYICLLVWLCPDAFVTQTNSEFCFDANNQDHRLNTAILKKVHALSGPECVLRCLNNTCCRSVNYNKRCISPENCELLHDVPSEKYGNLIFDERFDNFVLLQPNRAFNCSCVSCKKNERCYDEFKNCSCAFGFNGDRCIEARAFCEIYKWWSNENYTDLWVDCPSSMFMAGLNRTTADTGVTDTLKSIVGMKCCNVTNTNLKSECEIDNSWRRSLDGRDSWGTCPEGYFVSGLDTKRKKETVLANIDKARCCKLQGFPHKYSDCYEEDVSQSMHFTKVGLSQCSKEKYYMAGFYKSNCNYMYCITKLKCCRMEYL